MESWSGEIEGGMKLSGRALIGWNASQEQIIHSGMDSSGGMKLGSVLFDIAAKTSTLTAKGADGDGKFSSLKSVITMTDKDTLTWQAIGRIGGSVEGPSPVYTFKRIKAPAPAS